MAFVSDLCAHGWHQDFPTNFDVVEAVGYVGRIIAHNNQKSIGIYIMQTLLLLVAPALYAASVYMTLGRIILHTRGEHLSPIKRTLLTKIFVIGDVFSFLVQSGGQSPPLPTTEPRTSPR